MDRIEYGKQRLGDCHYRKADDMIDIKILPQALMYYDRQKQYMHEGYNGWQEKENESDSATKAINKQENHVENNTGITGITGNGHIITINQCPKEVIEMLSKMTEILKNQL